MVGPDAELLDDALRISFEPRALRDVGHIDEAFVLLQVGLRRDDGRLEARAERPCVNVVADDDRDEIVVNIDEIDTCGRIWIGPHGGEEVFACAAVRLRFCQRVGRGEFRP